MINNSAPAIMWFRHDLRLADNPALQAACQHRQVIMLYVWAPGEEAPWSPGEASNWWLHRGLLTLDESLRKKGQFLVFAKDDSLKALYSLIKQFGVSAVYWNRRYEPAVIKRDTFIKSSLIDAGIHVATFNGSLLHEPWDVLKKDGTPYRIYTAYWKAVRLKVVSLDIGRRLKIPPPPPMLQSPISLNQLRLNPKISWDHGMQKFWRPGEQAGRMLMHKFIKSQLMSYSADRNYPAINGTSLLSPYLHFGHISPRQIWTKLAKKPINNPHVMPFLEELVWRDFASYILYHFPHATTEPLQKMFKNFPFKKSKKHLRAWQKGLTGYPIVDAGMRQLWQVGWMHNRVRMIVASFLVKDYLINWQEGAMWFWDTLVDADLANNTINWQWCAGCGVDPAPYFRIFNPVRQGLRFDPEGAYVRRWVPELKNVPNQWIHCPWEAPAKVLKKAGVILGKDYPQPTVDHFEAKIAALEAYDQLKSSQ